MKTKIISTLLVLAVSVTAAPTYADDHCAKKAKLELEVDKYLLKLTEKKKPICVTAPGSFKIKIVQPSDPSVNVPAGAARVHEKEGSALEIRGDNANVVNKIKVTVTGTADVGDEFDFLIEVDGVGILDPRIKIIDNDSLLQNNFNETADFFDTIEFDAETYLRMQDDQGSK